MALNFFLNAVKLVYEGLACIVLLHTQHALERFLLSTEDLHLLLVGAQMLLKGEDGVIEIVNLSFEVSGVI